MQSPPTEISKKEISTPPQGGSRDSSLAAQPNHQAEQNHSAFNEQSDREPPCSPHAGEPKSSSILVGGATLLEYARQMRKAPTPWEAKLWARLKAEQLGGYKFRRQQRIEHYIVDFVNYEKRIIVELDGMQHADSEADKIRDAYLQAQGFTVLRFWNNALSENLEGVLMHILEVLNRIPRREIA